jgi:hypothetical protein
LFAESLDRKNTLFGHQLKTSASLHPTSPSPATTTHTQPGEPQRYGIENSPSALSSNMTPLSS